MSSIKHAWSCLPEAAQVQDAEAFKHGLPACSTSLHFPGSGKHSMASIRVRAAREIVRGRGFILKARRSVSAGGPRVTYHKKCSLTFNIGSDGMLCAPIGAKPSDASDGEVLHV